MEKKIIIHVITNASKPEVIEINETEFKVKIDRVAEKGKANKRLIEVLSKYLNKPKNNIKIIKGEKSHNKIVLIN